MTSSEPHAQHLPAQSATALDASARRAVRSWSAAASGTLLDAAAAAALEVENVNCNEALGLLTLELRNVCTDLVSAIAPASATEIADEPLQRDRMLRLDANFALWVAAHDAEMSKIIREKGIQRLARFDDDGDADALFRPWNDDGLWRLRTVALVLWRTRVAALWERLQFQHPATPTGVLELLSRASYGASLDANAKSPALRDRHGEIIAEFSTAVLDVELLKSVFDGRALLATVAGTQLLRWEITKAHRQYVESLSIGGDFRRTIVDSGWLGLTEQIGAPHASAHNVRAMVLAQAHGRFTLPNGSRGNLLTYEEPARAGPGKPPILKLIWGDALLPRFVHALPPGRAGESHRRNRVLVPVLERLPELRRVAGRAGGKGKLGELSGAVRGAAAFLHWLVLIDLSQGAQEWRRFGGVRLDWSKLWVDAGLSEIVGKQVRESWLSDGADAPAMLELVGQDRYILGKFHEKAARFILQRNDLADQYTKKKSYKLIS